MKKLYSIYDVKAGYYAPPFVANNADDAERQIAMALMASPTIPPAMYPEDFYLEHLGDWDDVSGVIASNLLRISSCELILRKFSRRKKTSADDDLPPVNLCGEVEEDKTNA